MNSYQFTQTFKDHKKAQVEFKKLTTMFRQNGMPMALASLKHEDKTVSFTVAGNMSAVGVWQRLGEAWAMTPTPGSAPMLATWL